MRRPTRLPMEALRPYLLEPPTPPGPDGAPATPRVLDWSEVFGNPNPVEVEVGFGKGLFLLNASAARPEVNFLGVEIVRKYQFFTATRLAKRGRRNVRLVCADARAFFRDHVATGSVQGVHVYFPDPWWKKRHHKRRVFTPKFLADCTRILAPGGRLHVATDVPEYAEIIQGMAEDQPGLVPLAVPAEHEPAHDLDYLTNFDRKFRQQGKPVHRMAYERSELPSFRGVASSAPEATPST
jgi:tRNA (guanine-N7-)-methyltransferase